MRESSEISSAHVEERPKTLLDILQCPCGFAIAPSTYKMEWPDGAVDPSKIVEGVAAPQRPPLHSETFPTNIGPTDGGVTRHHRRRLMPQLSDFFL